MKYLNIISIVLILAGLLIGYVNLTPLLVLTASFGDVGFFGYMAAFALWAPTHGLWVLAAFVMVLFGAFMLIRTRIGA